MTSKYRKWTLIGGQEPKTTRWNRKRREMLLRQKQLEAVNEAVNVDNEMGNVEGNLEEAPCVDVAASDSIPVGLVAVRDRSSSTSPEPVEYTGPQKKIKKKRRKQTITTEPLSLSGSSSSDDSVEGSLSRSPSVSSVASVTNDDNNIALETSAGEDAEEKEVTEKESASTICKCTKITATDVLYMVLTVGVRHSLSWDAQVDFLKIIGVMHGESAIPTTKYKYLQNLQVSSEAMTGHIFCDVCEQYLGKKSGQADVVCNVCGKTVNPSNTKNYFLSLSVSHQLQLFLKDDVFVKNILNYRFNRQSNPSQYSDIYDGDVYRKLVEDGILSNPYNFSYCFFTDGIAFGASSNKTLWPIYLTINELPYEDRAKYLLLAGLYVGPKDPNLQMFMEPFVEDANHLSETGVSWVHNQQNVTSLVVPLCGIADSVARFKLINLSSFHACYGCTMCYIHTERTRAGRRYVLGTSGQAALRTAESTAHDLHQVYLRRNEKKKEDRVYKGVKGVCPLAFLNYFNFSPSKFPVDYMHNILLGVVKFHTELLLEPARKKFWDLEDDAMGMEHIIAAVDEKIVKIQSSSSIMRQLRPLKDKAKWRANEYKSWLLFYFYPCCSGLLKKKHIRHLSMLSRATFLFLKKTITTEELTEADNLCTSYTEYFQKYFGVECMRYNIHLLSHLSTCVCLYGPLWSLNSFLYEAQNRYIKQLAKNPNTVILEIAKKFLIHESLPFLCSELASSEATVNFTSKIMNYKHLKNFVRSKQGYGLLGKAIQCSLSQEEQTALLEHTGSTSNYLFFQRVLVNGTKYCTSSYSEGKKNNDSCAKTAHGELIEIKHMLLSFDGILFLLAEKLTSYRTELDHIKQVERSGIVKCFNADCLSQPCIIMNPNNQLYVSVIPYGATVE